MKSYLDVDYTCFVQLETLKMKAIFKKKLLQSLHFLRFLKMKITGIINISITFNSHTQHGNRSLNERAMQNGCEILLLAVDTKD